MIDRKQRRLSGDGALNQTVLDEAVTLINQTVLADALTTARHIGEYVLRVFFGNDTAVVEDGAKRGLQNTTFRALASDPRLRVSASWLWFAVHVAVSVRHMPIDVASSLPLSHHRLLLRVKNPVARATIAAKAMGAGWSKERLDKELGGTSKRPPSSHASPCLEARSALQRIATLLGVKALLPGSAVEIRVLEDIIYEKLRGKPNRTIGTAT